jgi:hypothetical protein
MRSALVLITALSLLGCAAQPKQTFIRTDGQTSKVNPAVVQQFEIDKTVCEGETQKANLSGASYCSGVVGCAAEGASRGNAMQAVAKGCMAQRGYVLVLEEEAEARAAEFRRMSAAQNPPEPAKHPAPVTSAKKPAGPVPVRSADAR